MHLTQSRPNYLGELPPGEPGTKATLGMMSALVQRFKSSMAVRSAALTAVRGLPPKDIESEVGRVFYFVRDHIRYVRDVRNVETLQTPDATLELEQGDCDDKSSLLASMLEAIGHPTRFVAVGYTRPGAYQHVYVEVRIGPRWVPLDATVSGVPVGWAPRTPIARLVVQN